MLWLVDINRIVDQEVKEKIQELGDFRCNCDITMKQISMGNVNFWISPEKAVSKVRQLLHLECQSSLRLILVVNMSNVNTRNRKPGLVWTCWNWSYEKPQFTVHRGQISLLFLKIFFLWLLLQQNACFMQSINQDVDRVFQL